MAITSPDNLRTPDPGDPYNLVADLATLAGDVQNALDDRGNAFKGTVSERNAFESSAPEGSLWVDTDGINMIWRKGASVFEPAVWRWAGTSVQMNGFSAPDGFSWFNTTDDNEYIRFGGNWVGGAVNLSTYLVSGASGTFTGFISGGLAHLTLSVSGINIPSLGGGDPFVNISNALPVPFRSGGVIRLGTVAVNGFVGELRVDTDNRVKGKNRTGTNWGSGTMAATAVYPATL